MVSYVMKLENNRQNMLRKLKLKVEITASFAYEHIHKSKSSIHANAKLSLITQQSLAAAITIFHSFQ